MKDRTGEINYNNFGSKMVIKEYRKAIDIDVYFPEYNYTKTNVDYGNFKKGTISCVYERRTFGVGYLGEGKYTMSMNGKHTKCYSTWLNMLARCYHKENEKNYYQICEVRHEWHNFQGFSDWFQANYYEIEGQLMNLDKDILCKGNKIYSPDTCVFVPQNINKLFTKRDNCRGDLPIGVVYNKSNKKYNARCDVNGKKKTLGYYNTPEEAFQVYKNFKENYIKEVAEEYKNVIPQKLYKAMINYKVEIND